MTKSPALYSTTPKLSHKSPQRAVGRPRFCNSHHPATYLNNSTTTNNFIEILLGFNFMTPEALESALKL